MALRSSPQASFVSAGKHSISCGGKSSAANGEGNLRRVGRTGISFFIIALEYIEKVIRHLRQRRCSMICRLMDQIDPMKPFLVGLQSGLPNHSLMEIL